MSLSSSAIQALTETNQHPLTQPDHNTPLLAAALVLSVYAANLSRKQLRRMKRKAMWALLKAKVCSLFGLRDTGLSTRTLMYILIGLGIIILAFVAPVAAVILLLLALIFILLNK
jgi:hypothetical protein